MKNVSTKTKSKNESPKTPGGISKSLLTPCRRVGLSRNWKNKGPSPFISPLASNTSNTVDVVAPKKDSRKRKSVIEPDEKSDENVAIESANDGDISAHSINTEDIVKTPLRNLELPRRKKSKTFLDTLSSQSNINVENSTVSPGIDDCTKENMTTNDSVDRDNNIENPDTAKESNLPDVSSLKTSKIIQKSVKLQSSLKIPTKITSQNEMNTISVDDTAKEVDKLKNNISNSKTSTVKSPNELTKECIVVIQKKLLKVKEKYEKCDKDVSKPKKNSQSLFDSDDEAPLSTLNKTESTKHGKSTMPLDDDTDEFIETPRNKTKKTEITKLKTDNKPKSQAPKPVPATVPKAPPQSSFVDDDDDFFDKKKTIIIRKTYDKVSKPNKAKSTGSITQKDIENLKARIEVKKKMLLARSMTAETEELRGLIKKWQKGCQEALVELMDMMRLKCPDKHDMDYSEILQMLKIPASLVGYDSDHDCFNTPDDSSAVLSKYNDF